ncbi:hypothetical protein DMZ48_08785 [Robertkochia solimangrovi]|nr:hypothetical protein DMZ48_08785 [Robertkochia solimangrovi]
MLVFSVFLTLVKLELIDAGIMVILADDGTILAIRRVLAGLTTLFGANVVVKRVFWDSIYSAFKMYIYMAESQLI